MTEVEVAIMFGVIGTVVAAISIWVAIWANAISHGTREENKSLGERMLAIEEARDTRASSDAARALFEHDLNQHPTSRFDFILTIRNRGNGLARDVIVKLDDVLFYEHCSYEPMNDQKGPFRVSPGGKIKLTLSPDNVCQLPSALLILWEDGSGTPGEYESPLSV